MKYKLKFINRKRAQFYILTAVIFCVIIFVLFYTKQSTGNIDTTFRNVYDNYIYESSNVINAAVNNNRNLSDEFENYTTSFINYAKGKNINLKIFYIVSTNTNTTIGNHLGEKINISGYLIENDNYIILNKLDDISLNFEDNTYTYDLSSNEEIQFKALVIKR